MSQITRPCSIQNEPRPFESFRFQKFSVGLNLLGYLRLGHFCDPDDEWVQLNLDDVNSCKSSFAIMDLVAFEFGR
jgi:hypothetical protein